MCASSYHGNSLYEWSQQVCWPRRHSRDQATNSEYHIHHTEDDQQQI